MPRRHPALPTVWLMTDERQGDGLWRALAALPPGAGIVFRHHATPLHERRRLWRRVARIARARRLMLVRAGTAAMPGEAGVHGRVGCGLVTWPAHDRREALRGVRAGASLLFVSPVFPTRSHPGAPAIGVLRARGIAQGLAPAIALGGMDARRFRRIACHGFAGWAAIDALTPDRQKRKAVPT